MSTMPRSLTTSRLRMRAWQSSDAERLRVVLDDNDAHLRPTIPFMSDEPRSVDETRRRVEAFAEDFRRALHFRYAIFDDNEASLLGEVMLLDRCVEPGGREVGYWMAESACGRGLASEAVGQVVHTGFETLDIDYLEFVCEHSNTASANVALRLGAKFVEKRSARSVDGARDVLLDVLQIRRGSSHLS